MMTQRFFVSALALAAVGAFSCLGLAEVVERTITDQGDSMRFDDEQLLGSELSASGDIFRLRPQAKRVTLIRPRTAFITELTKSLEDF
jgi:hypothetical protein